MARPASSRQAIHQTQGLLIRRLPGARKTTVRSHLKRAAAIAKASYQRWQVGPYQWRVKHLRWYLEHRSKRFEPGTRYRYWLTIRLLVMALGREADWLPRLQGPWCRPGEPPAQATRSGRPVKRPSRPYSDRNTYNQ